MRYDLLFFAALWVSLILLMAGAPSALGQVVHPVHSIESHVEISKLEADSSVDGRFGYYHRERPERIESRELRVAFI